MSPELAGNRVLIRGSSLHIIPRVSKRHVRANPAATGAYSLLLRNALRVLCAHSAIGRTVASQRVRASVAE